jgi:hypothetical protein
MELTLKDGASTDRQLQTILTNDNRMVRVNDNPQ